MERDSFRYQEQQVCWDFLCNHDRIMGLLLYYYYIIIIILLLLLLLLLIFTSKTIFFLHNSSVQLTYGSLKRAKFGSINDLVHFWLSISE